MAQLRPSLVGPGGRSATASGYCHLGHIADSDMKTASERLAAAVPANVSCVVDRIIGFDKTSLPHVGCIELQAHHRGYLRGE